LQSFERGFASLDGFIVTGKESKMSEFYVCLCWLFVILGIGIAALFSLSNVGMIMGLLFLIVGGLFLVASEIRGLSKKEEI